MQYSNLGFKWYNTSISENQIEVSVEFENPSKLSQYPQFKRDYLRVKLIFSYDIFGREGLIRSEEYDNYCEESNSWFNFELMP